MDFGTDLMIETFSVLHEFSALDKQPDKTIIVIIQKIERYIFFMHTPLFLNLGKKMVAGPRIELGTRGFSVPCSTD